MADPDSLRLRRKVLERGRVKNKTLLDVGAGPLGIIAARDFGCRVTSIDLSKEKLKEVNEEAVEDGIKGIRFKLGDATDLPYSDNSFDVVVSYGTLHHIYLDKRKEFVHEVHRVAKEKLIIAEYTKTAFDLVHPDGEYKPVGLDWLEEELNSLGKVEKYIGREMNIYVCFK
ncbi:MAG: class I SAM-dependent methyltransferase [Candidatus Altiarchaeales archaeon]|nr:class I SAM-dependent methyltransferase [Candidatus Altiarchaeales archaeon]